MDPWTASLPHATPQHAAVRWMVLYHRIPEASGWRPLPKYTPTICLAQARHQGASLQTWQERDSKEQTSGNRARCERKQTKARRVLHGGRGVGRTKVGKQRRRSLVGEAQKGFAAQGRHPSQNMQSNAGAWNCTRRTKQNWSQRQYQLSCRLDHPNVLGVRASIRRSIWPALHRPWIL